MSQGERSFEIDELFFSKTDSRGLILSGNSVFQRISGYSWSELLNKPHNLIRHPDMPRGVFHLFWETIQNNSPIGAFVKNRARTGEYYWVYALAFPIPEGFVSIRLKPTSELFYAAQNVYKKVLEIETRKKISPAESQRNLIAELGSLGFPTYLEFMTKALVTELELRNKALNRPNLRILKNLKELISKAKSIESLSQNLDLQHQKFTHVPLNLEILTNNIGEEGASLSVVATQYEKMADEIHGSMKIFMELSHLIKTEVDSSQFSVCASYLQREIYEYFAKEKDPSPIDINLEMKTLKSLQLEGIQKARLKLDNTEVSFDKFHMACNELRQLALGLEIVRLTGKIEASKVSVRKVELESLMHDLNSFKTILKKTIDELSEISQSALGSAEEIASDLH